MNEINKIINYEITPSAKLILIVLFAKSDENLTAQLSFIEIAQLTGLSLITIPRQLTYLKDIKAIEIWSNKNANIYSLEILKSTYRFPVEKIGEK